MNEDYINEIEKAERRFITFPVEYREDDNGGAIEGVAAVVETKAGNDWFDEQIDRGAFKDVMKDDVRVLFNHDPNQVLARTKSKTADIFLDNSGNLAYRFKTPNRQFAKDVEDMIRSGDVSQSSFAFRVKKDTWIEEKGKKPLRIINEIERLYDVSPVTYPWYASTTVSAKKSYDSYKQEIKQHDDDEKAEVQKTADEMTKRLIDIRVTELEKQNVTK